MSLSQPLFAVGTILILHAAYSCLNYRSLLNELGEEDEAVTHSLYQLPPMDVWAEVLLGFVCLLFSELTRGGSALRPIDIIAGKSKPLMAPAYRTREFDVYTGRRKAL